MVTLQFSQAKLINSLINFKSLNHSRGCGADAAVTKYENGCLLILENIFLQNIGLVVGVSIVLVVLQLVSVILACCVGSKARHLGYVAV